MGMPFAGMLQQFEALVIQVEQLAPQGKGVLCGKFSMVQFKRIILPAGIVQDGEEPDNVN